MSPTFDSRSPSPSGQPELFPVGQPRFLAFDLEISKTLIDDFNQWKDHRPLGISCAATLLAGEQPRLWFSREPDQRLSPQMNRQDLSALVDYLKEAAGQGSQIVTWNGLGFDFDVLAEESDHWDTCRELALNHIDMMFHFFCLQGYFLGLDKAAKGMGLSGKMEGMSGELAPKLWGEGQFDQVLEYVSQDVVTTLGIAQTVQSKKYLAWTSNAGKPQRVSLPQGWLAVQQALQLPLPDTSWMKRPVKRSDYLAWTSPENKKPASAK
jgi:hypothetical protein